MQSEKEYIKEVLETLKLFNQESTKLLDVKVTPQDDNLLLVETIKQQEFI